MGELADELRTEIKGTIDDSKDTLEKASRDASLFKVLPKIVLTPRDSEDVENVVRFVSKHNAEGRAMSITPRSAGTDMGGGPLNDSIIINMLSLNRLDALESKGLKGSATVEPGMYFRDFDRETKKKGLELPSYTASRELNTVGGMVANNSGGEKNLKYGKTARYVRELEVVLSDGKRHSLKKMEGEELSRKLKEETFEGRLYSQVAALIRDNKNVIKEATPHVEKNSSGYALWNIGDGVESLDLSRLMVGAQGTLGIITKIKFDLVRPEPFASMLIVFIKNLHDLGTLVPAVLNHAPDSFESYDDHTFALAIKYFPEFAAQMKTGMVSLGISFLPEIGMLLAGGVPKLVLMIEFRADTQEEALRKTKELKDDLVKLNLHEKMHIAKDERAARKYWVIRRESFNLLRKKIRGMRTAPFIDDFVVPPRSLDEFLPKLTSIMSGYDIIYTVAGHVGDGNFHIIPLIDPKRPDARRIIEELSQKVYDLVLSYHGSISGEHNDGLVRTPYVEQMFGEKMEKLFERVKDIFDPLHIFNPGKKTGTSVAASLEKLDLPP